MKKKYVKPVVKVVELRSEEQIGKCNTWVGNKGNSPFKDCTHVTDAATKS